MARWLSKNDFTAFLKMCLCHLFQFSELHRNTLFSAHECFIHPWSASLRGKCWLNYYVHKSWSSEQFFFLDQPCEIHDFMFSLKWSSNELRGNTADAICFQQMTPWRCSQYSDFTWGQFICKTSVNQWKKTSSTVCITPFWQHVLCLVNGLMKQY